MYDENEKYTDSRFPEDGVGNYRPDTQANGYGSAKQESRGSSFRDASYSNVKDTPMVQPRYYYSGSAGASVKKERGPRMGAKGIIALCLAFSLVGGAGGGAATYFALGGGQAQTAETDGDISATDALLPVTSPLPTAVARTPEDGTAYTGSEIYNLGCPQTVGITTEYTTTNFFRQTSTNAVTGSGFIIRENGYIMTNYHVIETAVLGGYEIEVMLYNGEKYVAEVIGFEEENDIAVLKIDAEGLPAATLGDSDTLVVGERVYAIGNPLGELAYTLTSGDLSALDRDITLQDEATGDVKTVSMFQISAAVNSGNSGGPVYNSYGEVIGVVTAKYGSSGVEGLGFAIPINDAKYIAEELMNNGYVSGKAYFGITVQTVSASDAQYFGMPEGAYVSTVTEGSCAEKAGIKIGDVITRLGEKTVKSRSDLTNAKRAFRAGDTAEVELFRAGETLTVKVVFDEEPQGVNDVEVSQPEYPQTEDPRVTVPPDGDGNDGSGRWVFPFFGN